MRQKTLAIITAFICIFFAGTGTGRAEDSGHMKKPLWEFGLFNGAMSFPHYRGSDEQMYYLVAIPYFVYRGKIFRADREGFKGVFFKSNRLQSSISLSGYPPVNGNTEARVGMDDLGALFGFGPELRFYVNNRKAKDPLYVAAAVHGVSSVDFDSGVRIAFEGFRYSVNLVYRNTTFFTKKGSFFGINGGMYYADSGLNSYFYDVDRQYVRPDRPYYKSSSGYAGHSVNSYVIYRLTDILSLGIFGRWDNVRHATFHDSPLVKQSDTYMGGVSLIWKIAESKKMVDTH